MPMSARLLRPRNTLPPSAPTEVTGTSGDSQIALTWTAPTGRPISDYRVEISSNNGATWTLVSRPASTATSAAITGLTNATPYRFRVAAVNAVGTGPFSAASHSIAPFNYNTANLTLVYDTSLEPANNTVTVPLSGTVNCTIDWGDGTNQSFTVGGNISYTYAVPGVYVVQISGTMTALNYGTGASTTLNKLKLVRCLSFGNTGLTVLTSAFRNCSNLVQVPLSLPSTVITCLGTFFGASSFNQPIGGWNTAAVTNMSSMFQSATAFNQPISGWNTAAVTTMNSMFLSAAAFNQPIGAWNTAAVTNMASMFQSASSFNQPIGAWNTAAVTTMSSMFLSATSFNQPIGAWNTAAVTNMAAMFQSAVSFNQPIGAWNTAAVTNMATMFQSATSFNQPIGGWVTAAVTTMSSMFFNAASFNQPIGAWNTAAVTNMSSMLRTATAFNQPIGTWNTAAVTDMSNMFNGTTAFNRSVSDWNTAAVTTMAVMFTGANWGRTNYDAALVAWSALAGQSNVTAGFGTNQYSAGAAAAARAVLVGRGWIITDGGQAP